MPFENWRGMGYGSRLSGMRTFFSAFVVGYLRRDLDLNNDNKSNVNNIIEDC